MQKICWIGNDYFGTALRACGVELLRHIAVYPGRILSWRDICAEVGFAPDMVIVADSGRAPFVLGVEDFPCLTIFYSISPHACSWHGPYAQAFDACVVAQEGYSSRFVGPFLDDRHIWWLPPFARSLTADADGPREPGCIFIADDQKSPQRDIFLQSMEKRSPQFAIKRGKPGELMASHSMVLHVGADRQGLDFRIFEVLAAGTCLLMPRVGHGLEKLFVDGEHLVGFAPNDAGDAAYRLHFLLENPDIIRYIARTGQEEVASKHLAEHRVWELMDRIYELAAEDIESLVAQRRRQAPLIRKQSLAVPYLLCARELADQTSRAYEMAANGAFGLDGMGGAS